MADSAQPVSLAKRQILRRLGVSAHEAERYARLARVPMEALEAEMARLNAAGELITDFAIDQYVRGYLDGRQAAGEGL